MNYKELDKKEKSILGKLKRLTPEREYLRPALEKEYYSIFPLKSKALVEAKTQKPIKETKTATCLRLKTSSNFTLDLIAMSEGISKTKLVQTIIDEYLEKKSGL